MRRQGGASVVASPVLVGAVTILVTIVAVFLAYNANAGLPFVPTYDVRAELPSGAKLVKGNDVRVGGFRVGLVEELNPKVVTVGGKRRAVAEVRMKLDKVVEPLPVDTHAVVRPRSALGLKYVELRPGRSKENLQAGGTIALANTSENLELEDVYSTFDGQSRRASQVALQGFGDAFAGRGESINAAVAALDPFFGHLEPVARNLASPDTQLEQLFPQLGGTVAQVAPVAELQAELFADMADTFAAIGRNPLALQQTIERSPPTLATGITSFRAQRPFLAGLSSLSRRLRPAARELTASLPAVTDALRVGQPVVRRAPQLNERLGATFGELEDLMDNPNTLLALKDLRTAFAVTRPALTYLAPFQTVCNYTNYFFTFLGDHFGAPMPGGTAERILPKIGDPFQPNTPMNTESSRPVDVPANQDPQRPDAVNPPATLRAHVYNKAIDAAGNADCEVGQWGYVKGPLIPPGGRWEPSNNPAEGGGNHVVTSPDIPGLQGGTHKARELGIDNLKDVP